MTAEMLDAFQATAARRGEREALVASDGRRMTFRELDAEATALAGRLRAAGLGRGARAGILLENVPEFLVFVIGAWREGVVLVPLDTGLARDEIAAILDDARAGAILTVPASRDRLAADGFAVEDLGGGAALARRQGAPSPSDAPPLPPDVCLLKYTSGSTGAPKGVMLTERALRHEATNIADTLGIGPDDTLLGAIPLFHSYGFDFLLLTTLLRGSRLRLFERFVPRPVLAALRDEAVTIFPAVPSMLELLARLESERADLRRLRRCISAGAPLSARTARRFHERFGAPVCQHYGSSEAGALTIDLEPRLELPSPSVGRPLRNVAIRILGEDGRPVPPGEPGEVVVSSEAVASGYYAAPEETAAVFRAHGCHTGDTGRLGSDGTLYLAGRRRRVVITSGKKVDPGEVERALLEMPHVVEAVVLGVDHDVQGEVVKACIVADAALERAAVVAHLRERLAAFKIPQVIEFLPELPRNRAGKVALNLLGGR